MGEGQPPPPPPPPPHTFTSGGTVPPHYFQYPVAATILVISQLTLPLFAGICAKGYASMEHCTRSIYSNRAVT